MLDSLRARMMLSTKREVTLKLLLSSILFCFLLGCEALNVIGGDLDKTSSTPTKEETKPTPISTSKVVLAWGESKSEWTNYLMKTVSESKLVSFQPKGVCKDIKENQRAEFFSQLLSIMAKYESSFKPNAWMTESTMGIDPVTKVQIRSEGLFQLSYQDQKNYKLDCGFDWEKDKSLDVNDPKKTIFDPYKSMYCAVKILERWVVKDQKVFGTQGNNTGCARYWHVCRVTSKRQASIIEYLSKLPICNGK